MSLNSILCVLSMFAAISLKAMASGPDCSVKLNTRAAKFVDEVVKASNAKTLEAIKSSKESDLIQFHHDYGLWIRNKWLRSGKSSQQIVEAVTGDKKSDLDSASQRTIEHVWCRMKKDSA